MTWFPQLAGGSLAQYPLVRSRSWRSISNQLEDGSRVVLADNKAGQIEWVLTYEDLTDAERQNLTGLFAQVKGRFGAFSFVDPTANLLGWSEDLSQPDWQAGLLQMQHGLSDPVGTTQAWALTNGTAGVQSLSQTVSVPGEYVCCFSFWVRSATPGLVTLARDSQPRAVRTGPIWSRVVVGGKGTPGADTSTVSVAIGPGESVHLWGLQLDAQPYSSAYKVTGPARGIYPKAAFGMDDLVFRSAGPGRSSCSIVITTPV